MKKFILFMLVAVLVFSVVGCASAPSEDTIKKALVGKWGTQTADGQKVSGLGYGFNADGTGYLFMESVKNTGTYVIENGKIVLTFDSGSVSTFIYEYKDGELKLKTDKSEHWNLWKQ